MFIHFEYFGARLLLILWMQLTLSSYQEAPDLYPNDAQTSKQPPFDVDQQG